jgi:predicted nuclease of predicted toxin-antitoxin system
MHFLLDENVPHAVAEMLDRHGYRAEFIRDYVPRGASDPLVATLSQDLQAILVSFDGDFERIAPRIPYGQRRRFRRLSRIWLRCGEPQAAHRLQSALSLIAAEYELAQTSGTGRIIIQIGRSYLRTER